MTLAHARSAASVAAKDDVQVLGRGRCTVVALHGIQGTRDAWLPVIERMSQPLRWVLPNLRGRGAAPRGAGPADHGLGAYAADLRRIVATHVTEGPWLLAGWSLGVSVILQYLAEAEAAPAPAAAGPAGLLLVSGSPALCLTRWFAGEGAALDRAIVARRQRMGLTEHADDLAVRHTWLAIRSTDQRPGLTAGRPAAVLHGSDDDDCPVAHAHWLAAGLGTSAHLLPDIGHGVLKAAPDAVAQHLAELCRTASPGV